MSLERSPMPVTPATPESVEAGLPDSMRVSTSPLGYGARFSPALLDRFADPDRLCPMLAGVGWLKGNQMTLRLPTGDLVIKAPSRLLNTVFRLCDGTFTVNEILGKVKPEAASELGRFIGYLLEQGGLIDAIFATKLAARYAHQDIPIGHSAEDGLTLGIGGRFTARHGNINAHDLPALDVKQAPLTAFFAERRSTYTFDDRPLSLDALAAMLWSMGGVVADKHPRPPHAVPHRTLGSGGAMYLVRWILVLQTPVGHYQPGVYDVEYPRPHQVSLRLRSDDVHLLPRAFLKPWHLTHAAGAVFGIADASVGALRYRNRTVQYLFTEAGAALQNMTLSAPALGIATAILGGYNEDISERMLGLNGEILVGSAIFGSPPTPQQERQVAKMLPVDFVWADAKSETYTLPFHIARGRPVHKEGDEYYTWGKDADPRMAYVKAHAEAIERQGPREPRNIRVARMDAVPNPVLPSEIATYSEAQYAQPGFPYKRFNERLEHTWAPGVRVDDGAAVSIPAQFVYGRTILLPFQPRASLCLQFNSSGCAAGVDLDHALQAALLEVIERDAFMRHWMSQAPGLRIPDSQLSGAVLARVRQMRSRGCQVMLQLVQSAAAQVVLASATHEANHFTCVAAAARFDRNKACADALDEVESMVFTRLVGMKTDLVKPSEVNDPAAHTELYRQKAYFRKADRVLRPTVTAPPEAPDGCSSLEELCDVLIMQGYRPSYVEVTPERNCIDQGRTALTVVKAIVPGLIPVSFGYGREPRGMVPFVHPYSFFPHPFP